jgi:hypothetical protein
MAGKQKKEGTFHKMEICVAGWYFDYHFLEKLKEVRDIFKTTIVSHVPDAYDRYELNGASVIPIPNIGLEFGCYDHYLKEVWNGRDDVLFIHDDTKIKDSSVFHKISKLDVDCAYIFRDMAEEKANGGKHGRAIFCSKRFLNFIKNFECVCQQSVDREDVHHNKGTILKGQGPHTGFWYDKDNTGHVSGKPPVGIRHYNDAIHHFHWVLGRMRDQRCGKKEEWPNPKEKMSVVNRIFFSDVVAARRGCYKHIDREQKRYLNKPKPKICPTCRRPL